MLCHQLLFGILTKQAIHLGGYNTTGKLFSLRMCKLGVEKGVKLMNASSLIVDARICWKVPTNQISPTTTEGVLIKVDFFNFGTSWGYLVEPW